MLERNPLLPRLLILLIAMLACAPLLQNGAIQGHSLDCNMAWVYYFTGQLAQGDIYPRWLIAMHQGGGSPAFYYYGPLAYYIAAIPKLLFPWIELVTQHAIGETSLIALSGLTFYHYAQRRFAAVPALFGALIYMFLPYHFEIDLWTRQDLSEVANYIWLPLAIDYTERLFDGEEAISGLAIVYGCMMLTHLPTTLLFSLGLAGYMLVLTCLKPSWRFLGHFSTAIVIGILLAGIYWIPAVFCLEYIHAEEWWVPFFDFHRWFLPHPDIAHHNVDIAIFTNRLFDVLCLTTMIFTLCWLNALRWRSPKVMKKLWPCLALALISWFFMTSWSRILWETLPFLSKVQFPYRIAVVLDLATALVALLMMNTLYLQRDKLTALVTVVTVGLLLYSLSTTDVRFTLSADDEGVPVRQFYRDFSVAIGTDGLEYMPRWWNPSQLENNYKVMGELGWVSYDRSNGSVEIGTVVPRQYKVFMNVDLQKPTTLTFHQFYFPNWRASIVGTGAVLKINPAVDTGLIQIAAPAGKYQLQLKMGRLKEELIGAAMSGLALLLLLSRAVWMHWRHQARKTAATFNISISEN